MSSETVRKSSKKSPGKGKNSGNPSKKSKKPTATSKANVKTKASRANNGSKDSKGHTNNNSNKNSRRRNSRRDRARSYGYDSQPDVIAFHRENDYVRLAQQFPNFKVYDAQTCFNLDFRSINPDAYSIVEKIRNVSQDVYYVGGVARDLLAGSNYNDIDLATSATPKQLQGIFKNGCRLIGKRFPICHVSMRNKLYDVTTFRKHSSEEKIQSLSPDASYSLDIAGDAYRRDFTINALYVHVTRNHVLDFFNSLEDMAKRRVVMIGDPEQRLIEDPVRIIRAIRLASKMNFSLEPKLRQAMFGKRALLAEVSKSRLGDEVNKTLESGASVQSLVRMMEFDICSVCIPQFQETIMAEMMKDSSENTLLLTPKLRPYYEQAIKHFTPQKENFLKEHLINDDLLRRHSPTLALTLAGAAISDLRLANGHLVSSPFMLANIRAITFLELVQQVLAVLHPNGVTHIDEELSRMIQNIARVTFDDLDTKGLVINKNKDRALEILYNLAFIFLTPCHDSYRAKMQEPMFRAAFCLYKLYVQLFEVGEAQEANCAAWDQMHDAFEEKRNQKEYRNDLARGRKQVKITLSDRDLAQTIIPALLNIEYMCLVHSQMAEQGREGRDNPSSGNNTSEVNGASGTNNSNITNNATADRRTPNEKAGQAGASGGANRRVSVGGANNSQASSQAGIPEEKARKSRDVQGSFDESIFLKKVYSREVVKRAGTQVLHRFYDSIKNLDLSSAPTKVQSSLSQQWVDLYKRPLMELHYHPNQGVCIPDFALLLAPSTKSKADLEGKLSDETTLSRKEGEDLDSLAFLSQRNPSAALQGRIKGRKEPLQNYWLVNPLIFRRLPLVLPRFNGLAHLGRDHIVRNLRIKPGQALLANPKILSFVSSTYSIRPSAFKAEDIDYGLLSTKDEWAFSEASLHSKHHLKGQRTLESSESSLEGKEIEDYNLQEEASLEQANKETSSQELAFQSQANRLALSLEQVISYYPSSRPRDLNALLSMYKCLMEDYQESYNTSIMMRDLFNEKDFSLSSAELAKLENLVVSSNLIKYFNNQYLSTLATMKNFLEKKQRPEHFTSKKVQEMQEVIAHLESNNHYLKTLKFASEELKGLGDLNKVLLDEMIHSPYLSTKRSIKAQKSFLQKRFGSFLHK